MIKELNLINFDTEKIASLEDKHFYFGRFIPNTKFMFVAEMPTNPLDWNPYDNFDLSTSDKRFFELLNKNGFGGSYLTDIVKKTETPRRPTEKELLTWLPLLKREMLIIKPKVVVAVGPTSAYQILSKLNPEFGITNLEWIWHPSYVQRYNRWSEYEKQIKELYKKYE